MTFVMCIETKGEEFVKPTALSTIRAREEVTTIIWQIKQIICKMSHVDKRNEREQTSLSCTQEHTSSHHYH